MPVNRLRNKVRDAALDAEASSVSHAWLDVPEVWHEPCAVGAALQLRSAMVSRVTMTDLEMTRRCAEAMGLDWIWEGEELLFRVSNERDARTKTPLYRNVYDPLHDKAQAFELVEKMQLHICPGPNNWAVWPLGDDPDSVFHVEDADLLRAIVTCVAHLRDAGGKW